VRSRAIPASGERVPVIGLGTWKAFDVGRGSAERDPLRGVLAEFTTAGGRLVDTSPMYGRAETVLGDLVDAGGLRERLFLATKVWTTGRADGVRQIEESLRKLRVRAIDLLQVHNLVDVATHLDTLEAWKRDGIIRYVGVTHYRADAHEALSRLAGTGRIDFIQVNYSVFEPEAAHRLLPLAVDCGIAVIANRPFGGGTPLRALRTRPLPGWASGLGCSTWAQLLLKFVVAHPAVTCAIPATADESHLRDNVRAGEGELPDEPTCRWIRAAAT
jgi:diketogulonate reductase-like aldo/keto reductase